MYPLVISTDKKHFTHCWTQESVKWLATATTSQILQRHTMKHKILLPLHSAVTSTQTSRTRYGESNTAQFRALTNVTAGKNAHLRVWVKHTVTRVISMSDFTNNFICLITYKEYGKHRQCTPSASVHLPQESRAVKPIICHTIIVTINIERLKTKAQII